MWKNSEDIMTIGENVNVGVVACVTRVVSFKLKVIYRNWGVCVVFHYKEGSQHL
jgi:hypothetical protein